MKHEDWAVAKSTTRIPQERRRFPRPHRSEKNRWKRFLRRMQDDSQSQRTIVQFTFALLCVWIGIEFALFVRWGQTSAGSLFVGRPPGVEGFLPISALISLKYWFETSIINDIHPSGMFIFLAIVVVSVLLKKAFCGWLCPVGTLSESLWEFGQKLFGRTLRIPRWLDYPLRSLKYLLLLFFASAVWSMDVPMLRSFIYSPYNKMADVKMYLFFANITAFAFWSILVLMAVSVVIKNFWCRYLCPYGALLGVLSWLSPLKVTRNSASCIDCELCTKACPSNIAVHRATRVWSDECMACYACVEACPVKDTLNVQITKKSKPVPSWVFGTLVVGIFIGITGLAMLLGHWRNSIDNLEYLRRMQNVDSSVYQHNRGEVAPYGPND